MQVNGTGRATNGWLCSLLRFAAVLGGLLGVHACGAQNAERSNEPSRVARGHYFATGNADFDEFFLGLYRVQVRLQDAPSEVARVRGALSSGIVVSSEASHAQLATKLRYQLEKLAARGLRVKLELKGPAPPNGEPPFYVIRTNVSVEPVDGELLSRVETAATRLLRLSSTLEASGGDLARLELAAVRLESRIEANFGAQGRDAVERIRRNFVDAHRLLALMQARARETRADAESLLAQVVRAADTDDGSMAAAALADPGNPARGRKKARARSRSASPVRPSAPGAASSAPPPSADPLGGAAAEPARARDFEP